MFSAVERAGYIGASDMPWIMGDKKPPEILRWWECKVGLREQDPPTWAMRLGSLVGDAIVDEYERANQGAGNLITRRQEVVPSPLNDRFRSTLDGFMASRNAVIEAKFASPFMNRDTLFSYYYPQVAMQMHCTDADTGYLVIAQGTNDPIEIECVRSQEYEDELLVRCAAMLLSMDTMCPPVDVPAPIAVPPEKWRTVDLDRDQPNWAAALTYELATYEFTRKDAETHELAGKVAKELVPDDVGRVIAPDHIIARNKKGSLAITRRTS
jgi:predicted phage-related endonuclease